MSARPGEAEAVEAAAKIISERAGFPRSWWHEKSAREVMAAAYPLVARAVAEDIARQVEAAAPPRLNTPGPIEFLRQGMNTAAQIARNYITKEDK